MKNGFLYNERHPRHDSENLVENSKRDYSRWQEEKKKIKVRQLKTMLLIRAILRASYEKERSLAHESTANEPFVCIERKRGFFVLKGFT